MGHVVVGVGWGVSCRGGMGQVRGEMGHVGGGVGS